MNYGNTKHHAIANFYRVQLGLPKLESPEDAILFLEELFRIPLEELVTIPTLLSE
ncbi:MAG: hypothetical protein H7Y18_14895 [Clostridiaceae bacterium]|nr:hypothetical protein [Clostridiaceae bacterium]